MQVQHILVKALVARPPKSTLRLRGWLERLFSGVQILSGPHVFQTSETDFAAFTVASQTHCAIHISGSEFQMDFFTPTRIDTDGIIKRLKEFELGDHEILLIDRSGEFQILISCVMETHKGNDDPNDANEF